MPNTKSFNEGVDMFEDLKPRIRRVGGYAVVGRRAGMNPSTLAGKMSGFTRFSDEEQRRVLLAISDLERELVQQISGQSRDRS